ncbi:hypothetical protein ACFC1T_08125 [Kitasatospora sp. NPDC056076]|uniref:hypothetical protein n=1 Tax=Kitasatospora sp. NPDC056076 TaxID=3345703 RepID=UPI0035D679DA
MKRLLQVAGVVASTTALTLTAATNAAAAVSVQIDGVKLTRNTVPGVAADFTCKCDPPDTLPTSYLVRVVDKNTGSDEYTQGVFECSTNVKEQVTVFSGTAYSVGDTVEVTVAIDSIFDEKVVVTKTLTIAAPS